jgi:hypothetical protein
VATDEILCLEKLAYYYVFDNKLKIATTQAFGHGGITGYQPDKNIIHYQEEQKVRVVVGSDGFWDMIIKNPKYVEQQKIEDETRDLINMNIEELSDKVLNRWKQKWTCYNEVNGRFTKEFVYYDKYEPQDWDDCAVAVWDNYSAIP